MIPDIKTERLHLRLLDTHDIDLLEPLHQDPEVLRFFPKGTQDRQQTAARIADFMAYFKDHGIPSFMIFDRESDAFLGRCGFGPLDTGEVEVGYVLHQQYWGRGYATELLLALLQWARINLPGRTVVAMAPVDHLASQKVMRKAGMVFYKNAVAHGVNCCFYRPVSQ